MPKMQYKVKGETFEVDDRYEVKKKIGAGAYGLLCAATDKKDHESQVAVKKIKDAFEGRYRLQAHAARGQAAPETSSSYRMRTTPPAGWVYRPQAKRGVRQDARRKAPISMNFVGSHNVMSCNTLHYAM